MAHKCGECKHWHQLDKQTYACRTGWCDKVEADTPFECDGHTYFFDGMPYEDEVYEDVFGCFEEGAKNDTK